MNTVQHGAQERTVLVFGAYGGIGSTLVRRLNREGARLVVSGRDESRLTELATEVGALPLVADAADFDAVDSVVAETVEHVGKLDGVVNCSGSLMLKPAHMTRPDDFRTTIGIGLDF